MLDICTSVINNILSRSLLVIVTHCYHKSACFLSIGAPCGSLFVTTYNAILVVTDDLMRLQVHALAIKHSISMGILIYWNDLFNYQIDTIAIDLSFFSFTMSCIPTVCIMFYPAVSFVMILTLFLTVFIPYKFYPNVSIMQRKINSVPFNCIFLL